MWVNRQFRGVIIGIKSHVLGVVIHGFGVAKSWEFISFSSISKDIQRLERKKKWKKWRKKKDLEKNKPRARSAPIGKKRYKIFQSFGDRAIFV